VHIQTIFHLMIRLIHFSAFTAFTSCKLNPHAIDMASIFHHIQWYKVIMSLFKNNIMQHTKVAVVTGSSSGIGFETSVLLARKVFTLTQL